MFKRKALGVIFVALVIFLFSAFIYLRSQYVVPIIMYHSVDPNAHPRNKLAVTADTFERQMGFLKAQHYNVVPLEELVRLVKEKKKLPPKTIAITLDDGYKNTYTHAFPILKKYGLPATVFIIINEVGRIQQDRLSWEEIRQMRDSGIIFFGSHSMGPDPLIKIHSQEALKREIFESKKRLEEELAQPAVVFSYPEGMFDDKIRGLVIAAGYQGAVATNPGPDYPDDDIYALKRIRISENSKNMFVFWIETSGVYTFMKEWKKKGD